MSFGVPTCANASQLSGERKQERFGQVCDCGGCRPANVCRRLFCLFKFIGPFALGSGEATAEKTVQNTSELPVNQ